MQKSNGEILAELKAKKATTGKAYKRITTLFDEGSFVEINGLAMTSEEDSGVVAGYGYIDGNPAYAFAQDITVSNGAVGAVHAAKIKKVYENAAKTGYPVIGIFDSDGVRLDEGNAGLAAYGEILAAANKLSGVVPQISVVAGTCAGCSAMMACSADFVVMSKDAELFMTPPFVSKAKGDNTPGAGSAENAAASGVVQVVAETDEEAIAAARRLACYLPSNNLSMVPIIEYDEPTAAPNGADCKAAAALAADRDSLFELSSGFAGGYTALGRVQGSTVGFVGVDGAISSDTAVKIARFVRMCDAFSIPVVTLVNSVGFDSTAKDELAGSIRSAAVLAHSYAEATTPKVTLITGNCIGAANVVFSSKGSNSDLVYAFSDAVVAPFEPETAVEFFWHERLSDAENLSEKRSELAEEYAAGEGGAIKAAQNGLIDDVILPEQTRQTIEKALDMLAGKRVNTLPKKHANMPL